MAVYTEAHPRFSASLPVASGLLGFSLILLVILGICGIIYGIGAHHSIARQSVRPNAEALDYWWRRRFITKRMRWR